MGRLLNGQCLRLKGRVLYFDVPSLFRYCGFFYFFSPPSFSCYLNIDTTFMLILLVLHVLTNNTANASEISIVNKACYSKLAFYRACFIISCYLAFCNGIIQR